MFSSHATSSHRPGVFPWAAGVLKSFRNCTSHAVRGCFRGCCLGITGGLASAAVNSVPAAAAGPERVGTVVCVPGFMRGKGNLSRMCRTLTEDGWYCRNWVYPTRDRTIEEHARRLCLQLQRLAAARPGQPVHFVTHSMGALVLRATLSRPDCPPEARSGRAVLIAAPNRGSVLARRLRRVPGVAWVFGSAAGAQLLRTPAGGFDALGAFPPSVEVLAIAGASGHNPLIPGPDDGKVGVWETSLPTPYERRVIRATHSWIANSSTAQRLTRQFLDAAPARPRSKGSRGPC